MSNNNLRLSLKKKWFDMTKAGIKTEDYREINEYWVNRLFNFDPEHFLVKPYKGICVLDFIDRIHEKKGYLHPEVVFWISNFYGLELRSFDRNVMTLGYPKTGDTERTLVLEHKGIEIRTGNPDWGAEPDKLYFVIKHGQITE